MYVLLCLVQYPAIFTNANTVAPSQLSAANVDIYIAK
jgi:hypothetical protein